MTSKLCYIAFISHSLHWRCINIALRKYVIISIIKSIPNLKKINFSLDLSSNLNHKINSKGKINLNLGLSSKSISDLDLGVIFNSIL